MFIRVYRSNRQYPAVEHCVYVELSEPPRGDMLDRLYVLLVGPDDTLRQESCFWDEEENILEVGPRVAMETPFSSNAVAICQAMGIPITRLEYSVRYFCPHDDDRRAVMAGMDRMTQEIYPYPLSSFETGVSPEPVEIVDVLGRGEEALREANAELGLGMDAADIALYTAMFRRWNRNPTVVELFQLGNMNSEHSRHSYFRGLQVIDGVEMPYSLMDLVQMPYQRNPGACLVAFHDNSGVMLGANVLHFAPIDPARASEYGAEYMMQHVTATAETHNHPTLIAPFPGAETGSGGRIRDNRAVGRGGLAHVGVAGYCVAGLHIPEYFIPGEVLLPARSTRYASPLSVLIRGSDGISDYGNKIGEPLIGGFVRSFDQQVDGHRRAFMKPVLYTGGIGRVPAISYEKRAPEAGMLIVRIGGPAYRIGVGGGSASSMIGGAQSAELDFKSVQRGDAETENRANRVIQSCVEMGYENPIESIHDQGAGGISNVLTELVEPLGGRVDIRTVTLGDRTMSVLEIWVAEYQEGYGLLVRPENFSVFQTICERERVNCELLGEVTGDGRIVVEDSTDGTTPVNLPIKEVLSEMPRKRIISESVPLSLSPLSFPEGLEVAEALRKVFQLPSVGSKGYLVHKADRSVTGFVVQQQCCGPMQVAVADVGISADGFFGNTGAAVSIGEQSNKMFISPEAGARMAIAEMLTNLASVRVSDTREITCRVNCMWAAKLPGEGARLYEAYHALSATLTQLSVAPTGGKDSLSMAVEIDKEIIVAPGEIVFMGVARVPDVNRRVTPDLKGEGMLGFVDLGQGRNRLGGSALAQAHGQLGDEAPDVDDIDLLRRAFAAIQALVNHRVITAYHDRSDGGLITTVAEMCIAGNRGATVSLPDTDVLACLFAEEAGMAFEYPGHFAAEISAVMHSYGVPWQTIGSVTPIDADRLGISVGGRRVFSETLPTLRQWWEETSSQLDARQANPETVRAERESHAEWRAVRYHVPFDVTSPRTLRGSCRPRVAVLREEGTNGDREMAAACHYAGFAPVDVSMRDIRSGDVASLDGFRGVFFPGGFSFADTFGSAKGWAGQVLFDPQLREMFDRFYEREDTFSLGVCNGCQLMAHLGWVPWRGIQTEARPWLLKNSSGRFESRWSVVRVLPSPSIMLAGMEGTVMGVHVAHGEGRWWFPDPSLKDEIRQQQLAPLAFVDVHGDPTEQYPYNPNGSPEGWTALCSADGRHLAMMPHPERAFLMRQWHWVPEELRHLDTVSPWLQMFVNARDWCLRG